MTLRLLSKFGLGIRLASQGSRCVLVVSRLSRQILPISRPSVGLGSRVEEAHAEVFVRIEIA
jgi:hypothetical protein